MLFSSTRIPGAFLVDVEKRSDSRGFFARAWSNEEFVLHGLNAVFVQANISFSQQRGTLRGLHYQVAPHGEVKLIRCTRGAVYDVIVDLRRGSPAYLQWIGVELSEESRRMLYVPEGCAHGYQTLTDAAEVFYPTSAYYRSDAERGVRFDDPTFGIEWPLKPSVISTKDSNWPDYVAR